MAKPKAPVARLRKEAPATELSGTLAPCFYIQVVDEQDQPLAGEKYAIFQDGKQQDTGLLDSQGLAFFIEADETKPFRFEVQGRVCAIVRGMSFIPEQLDKALNEGGIEYGGSFVDWADAEDDSRPDPTSGSTKAGLFWFEYRQYAAGAYKPPEGPVSFWQHDHITRRDVKITKRYLDQFVDKVALVRAIPLQIRVGPLVRFTSPNAVVIWVELETPGLVRAKFKAGVVHYGTTVRVGGRHFALVHLPGLAPESVYEYTLELAPLPSTGDLPTEESAFTEQLFPRELKPAILRNFRQQIKAYSVTGDEWLSFRTLRASYDQALRFGYGSCRKKHGIGVDSLESFGEQLQRFKDKRTDWPAFLLFIGDQIYADDIEDSQGQAIGRHRFGARRPGPQDSAEVKDGAWAGRFAHRFNHLANAAQMRGLRSGRGVTKGKVLMRLFPEDYVPEELGERDTMRTRFLAFNHLLWEIPVEEKDVPTVTPASIKRPNGVDHPPAGDSGIHASDFVEFAFLHEKNFTSSDPVRLALANCPSFMVFDDHEITDDWNFDLVWTRMIFNAQRDPYQYWPKTIADGLAAYWMYQGWGNLAPADWGQDPRVQLLDKARASGADALPDLRKLLYDQGVRTPSSLTWSYKLPIERPLFLVMDGRTQRLLADNPQNAQMMPNSQFASLQSELEKADQAGQPAVFVVAADPIVLPVAIGLAQRAQLLDEAGLQDNITRRILDEAARRDRDIEHWMSNHSWDKVVELFQRLSQSCKHLKTVAFLSGDVHFSYNMLATLGPSGNYTRPQLLQLVCSALKNEIGAEREYKLRKLTETKSDAYRGMKRSTNDAFTMSLVRWLASPSGFEIEFDGMSLQAGGFRGVSNLAQTAMANNSVALVDAWFVTSGDPIYSPGTVVIRESFITNNLIPLEPLPARPPHDTFVFGPPVPGKVPAPPSPQFWYEASDRGSAMTRAQMASGG